MSKNSIRNKTLIKTRQFTADSAFVTSINSSSDISGGGVSSLADLVDTNIISENQTDGNVLEWQTDKWITSSSIPGQISNVDTKFNRLLNPDPSSPQIYAELSSRPYNSNGGDEYVIHIYANTGNSTKILKSWRCQFLYNRDNFSYISAFAGYAKKYYGTSLTVSNEDDDTLGPPFFPNLKLFSIGQIDQYTDFSNWEGPSDRLYLATVRLRVTSGSSNGIYTGYFGKRESFLIDQNGDRYGDEFGGTRLIGQPFVSSSFGRHNVLITDGT